MYKCYNIAIYSAIHFISACMIHYVEQDTNSVIFIFFYDMDTYENLNKYVYFVCDYLLHSWYFVHKLQ